MLYSEEVKDKSFGKQEQFIEEVRKVMSDRDFERVLEDVNKFDELVIICDKDKFASQITHHVYDTYNYRNGIIDGICEHFENEPLSVRYLDSVICFGKKYENGEDGVVEHSKPEFAIEGTYVVVVETYDYCTAIVNPETNNYTDSKLQLIIYNKDLKPMVLRNGGRRREP